MSKRMKSRTVLCTFTIMLLECVALQKFQTPSSSKKKGKCYESGQDGRVQCGMAVYARDATEVWSKGLVLQQIKDSYTVRLQDGEELQCKWKDILLRCETSLVPVNSLTELSPIHQAAVLDCLQQRYEAGIFYTGAGSTVVAVNPFRDVPGLYHVDTVLSYHQHGKRDPHIYVIGEEAYRRLVQELGNVNQTIIVSGESGAGKTVSAKHLVRYMTIVSSSESHGHTLKPPDGKGNLIERKILDSNPILEAFGNAVTKRNDNSSRFGKHVTLQFNRVGQIQGASIRTYLLEKTRVVHQSGGECNFHIFYQLVGAVRDLSLPILDRIFHLLKSAEFTIVPKSTGTVTENRCLVKTLSAMEEVGLSGIFQERVFEILAAVMFLGNVDFSAMEDEASQLVEGEVTSDAMCKASDLLGISPDHLEKVLLYRNITAGRNTRHSVFVKPVPQREAYSRKDCLTTLLYSRLFDWLVQFINSQIHAGHFDHSVGLLDIYGFEAFEVNSLEQLCINYANEKIQQHYVRHYLKDLQREYDEECLHWTFTGYRDNQLCLNLLEGQPSVFGVLNEEVYLNRKSNNRILGERVLNLASTPYNDLKKPKNFHSDPGFTVQHYAGAVTYRVDGLTVKNRDNVPAEIVSMLQCSNNTFVAALFEDFQMEDSTGRRKRTVLGKFKSSLDSLLSSLGNSDVHYIRCVKPNPSKLPGIFDKSYVFSQLVANGIVETVEISRKGFPARMAYPEFLQRYGMIIRNDNHASCSSAEEGEKENATLYDPLDALFKKQLDLPDAPWRTPTPRKRMRRRTGLSSADHTRRCCATIMKLQFGGTTQGLFKEQFGRTKLFLLQDQLEMLEKARADLLCQKARTIQVAWRIYRYRKERKRKNKAASIIQQTWRMYRENKRFRAIVLIQKCDTPLGLATQAAVKMCLARIRLKKLKLQSKLEAERQREKEREQNRKRSSTGSASENIPEKGNLPCKSEINHKISQSQIRKSPRLAEIDKLESRKSLWRFEFNKSERRKSGQTLPEDSQSEVEKSSQELEVNHVDGICDRVNVDESKIETVHSNVKEHNPEVKPRTQKLLTPRASPKRRICIKDLKSAGEPPAKRIKTVCNQFPKLQDLNIGEGIVTRRLIPKDPVKFHTRPSVLKDAHLIHQKALLRGVQDCLKDSYEGDEEDGYL